MARMAPVVLHVPIGKGCNNRCVFCMEHGRGVDRRWTLPEIEAQLDGLRSTTDAVTFTSGEPTLSRLLPEAVAAAKARGYRTIGLVTNGRRLSDAASCEALLAAGLDQVTVSLHGATAEVHDAVVGSRGAFSETTTGLRNAARLRVRYPHELVVTCTVVRANLEHMGALAALARELGAGRVNFNAVEPRGRADEGFDEVVPRYPDVVAAALATDLDFGSGVVSLARVPACAGGFDWAQEEWRLATTEEVVAYDPAEGRTKGPPCAACMLSPRCTGVWERYLRAFGWDDFTPIRDPAPLRGRTAEVALEPGALVAIGRLVRRGYRSVRLVGREPLLDADLPRVVRRCREAGADRVEVATDGWMAGGAPFARAVAALGVDAVVVRLGGAASEGRRARGAIRGAASLLAAGVPVVLRGTPADSAAVSEAARRLGGIPVEIGR